MNCATCGDIGKGRRNKLPCCKTCLKFSQEKWESFLDEMRRINKSARENQEVKPCDGTKAKGTWNG